MKVCLDIQSAVSQRAGVGRYTKCLAEHLGPLAADDQLALFYFDFKRKGMPFDVNGAQQHAVRWVPGRVVQGAWKKLGWPPFDLFAGEADVYHFPNFIRPPLRRGQSVVTLHDVAFLRYPETIEEGNFRYLSACIHETVERANRVITVSQFTANEVQELLKVPAEKVVSIPEGLEPHLKKPDDETITGTKAALGLDKPYLLTVGTLEPRKNIPFLVEVFEQLKDFEGDLVVAGMPGWKCQPILDRMQDSKIHDRIRYLRFVEEEHLAALYAGAELFTFPSLYEGFGFPPLEAMACETPVLAAATGSLPEVLGDGAVLVEGYDKEAWVAHINKLLADSAERDKLRVSGLARVQTYTWERAAKATWDVYRQLGN